MLSTLSTTEDEFPSVSSFLLFAREDCPSKCAAMFGGVVAPKIKIIKGLERCSRAEFCGP